ncbi:MAG: hypothetical protein V1712_02400 [Patescibacteria group bacterium]
MNTNINVILFFTISTVCYVSGITIKQQAGKKLLKSLSKELEAAGLLLFANIALGIAWVCSSLPQLIKEESIIFLLFYLLSILAFICGCISFVAALVNIYKHEQTDSLFIKVTSTLFIICWPYPVIRILYSLIS